MITFKKYVDALGWKRAFKRCGVPANIKPAPAGWRLVFTNKEANHG